MELAVKASGVALIVCVCMALIKKRAPEHALMLGCAAGVILFSAAIPAANAVRDTWESIAAQASLSGAVTAPVAKCVALGLITRLSADLCKDSGSSGLSSAVEIVGCVCALLAVSPLMAMLFEMIGGI